MGEAVVNGGGKRLRMGGGDRALARTAVAAGPGGL